MIRRVPRSLVTSLALAAGLAGGVRAQRAAPADSSLLTVERIYGSAEFRAQSPGSLSWLGAGNAYTTLEPSAETRDAQDVVRYDAATGAREILIPAARLVPPGGSAPLDLEEYAWSKDARRLLIFTNTEQVWRANTRGDYWVLDRTTWRLHKLGGEAPASTLMFAKFSPDGERVGYVRYGDYNLYVEDLATGRITRLTTDGSRTTINGTFDWVYEEELDLRDGWRWSPDGQWIAYWQLDATGVRDFPLYSTTDSLYAYTTPVQYPKAGETNSAAQAGVVSAAGGPTRWLQIPGDPRQNYIARMEWAPSRSGAPRELLIQHLNRLQNTLQVMLADAATGAVRTIHTERDSTWVELFEVLTFVNSGRDLLVGLSERSGWEHLYLIPRRGGAPRPVTGGAYDVRDVLGVDTTQGWVYYRASPDDPARRYLYRARLDGSRRSERLTPAGQRGTHGYDVSPNFRFAFHVYSRFDAPPVVDLVRLPEGRVLRTLVDNAPIRARLGALRRGRVEFTMVDVGGGVQLNAWLIKPPAFDSTRKYPVLFHVYGGPGSQTVLDAWGGAQSLWHQLLAQKGYIVASVDNRGTGGRGRAWRKIIYGQMGVVETQDQAAAAKAIGRLPYVDSTRVGIWGWSYGGFMSLNAITQHPDVYKAAVAVAPVTHWKYYDTIYTERYNGLPQDNAEGYDRGSPLTYAKNLRGNLLLVHGSGDDNVHYQNTEAMVNALVAADRPFSLMVYPNRTHGIVGGTTRQHLFGLLTRFIEEKL